MLVGDKNVDPVDILKNDWQISGWSTAAWCEMACAATKGRLPVIRQRCSLRVFPLEPARVLCERIHKLCPWTVP